MPIVLAIKKLLTGILITALHKNAALNEQNNNDYRNKYHLKFRLRAVIFFMKAVNREERLNFSKID
jgi:hypothetical protein